MLFDALEAETYRLLRNRMTAFWSVLFIPLLFAVGGIGFHYLTKSKGDPLAAQADLPVAAASTEALNLANALGFGANLGANGPLMVFMLLGAATVYAGDYRWETWRLITPRNSRLNLLLAKVGVMKLAAVAATLAMIVAAFVFFIAQGAIYGRSFTFSLAGDEAGKAVLVWLLSYIRIVQYGLIALLAAVATRSLLAALFVPWALGFVQSILGIPPVMGLLGLDPNGWPAQLLLPGMAYDTLKNAVQPGLAQTLADSATIWPSIVSLGLWIAVPLGLAVVLFQRQDLSKE